VDLTRSYYRVKNNVHSFSTLCSSLAFRAKSWKIYFNFLAPKVSKFWSWSSLVVIVTLNEIHQQPNRVHATTTWPKAQMLTSLRLIFDRDVIGKLWITVWGGKPGWFLIACKHLNGKSTLCAKVLLMTDRQELWISLTQRVNRSYRTTCKSEFWVRILPKFCLLAGQLQPVSRLLIKPSNLKTDISLIFVQLVTRYIGR
jgi:hypothetical protein